MKETFINLEATDGVKMHGILFEPEEKTKNIIIHIHGMAGNFYENSFISVMSKYYIQNNYAFLSCNNRGHDYICDLEKNNGEFFKGGAAYEIFEECVYDIDGLINFAQINGYENIILQGHSSGANKVIYWCSQKCNSKINGVILLSPCDDIGLHIDEIGIEKYNELINLANSFVTEGKEDNVMPDGTFYDYILSSKTYLSIFKEKSLFDIFHYRNFDCEFKEIEYNKIPTLVCFGNNGEFIIQDSSTIYDNVFKQFPNYSFEIIDGANHSYRGKEKSLLKAIIKWIKLNI